MQISPDWPPLRASFLKFRNQIVAKPVAKQPLVRIGRVFNRRHSDRVNKRNDLGTGFSSSGRQTRSTVDSIVSPPRHAHRLSIPPSPRPRSTRLPGPGAKEPIPPDPGGDDRAQPDRLQSRGKRRKTPDNARVAPPLRAQFRRFARATQAPGPPRYWQSEPRGKVARGLSVAAGFGSDAMIDMDQMNRALARPGQLRRARRRGKVNRFRPKTRPQSALRPERPERAAASKDVAQARAAVAMRERFIHLGSWGKISCGADGWNRTTGQGLMSPLLCR